MVRAVGVEAGRAVALTDRLQLRPGHRNRGRTFLGQAHAVLEVGGDLRLGPLGWVEAPGEGVVDGRRPGGRRPGGRRPLGPALRLGTAAH